MFIVNVIQYTVFTLHVRDRYYNKKQSCTKEVYINIAMKKTYIYEVFKEMTKGNETNIRFMNPKIIIVIVGK